MLTYLSLSLFFERRDMLITRTASLSGVALEKPFDTGGFHREKRRTELKQVDNGRWMPSEASHASGIDRPANEIWPGAELAFDILEPWVRNLFWSPA